ncbi:hypothetical protein [Halobacterium yunchengense]|uniref:hypothetical protein n=1 Tax=Halobacterium yunchengense TaxID=3108497 RepID=UPI00300A3CA2
MTDRPARAAAAAALSDWRRHVAAVAVAAAGFSAAAASGVDGAFFGAALLAFTVWMAWFVLTAIDFLGRANF